MTKQIHISDLLTVITGRLLSLNHMDGVYETLDYLSGQSLMTHQLPPASRAFEPVLRERFPQLAGIEIPEIASVEHLKEFIASVASEHGEYFEVEPMPSFIEGVDLDELLSRFGKGAA